MREIKFRALVKPLNTEQRWEYYTTLTLPTWIGFSKIIIKDLQFTGLYDRSGKEIYEGDILTVRGGYRGVVEYENGDAAYVLKTNESSNLLLEEEDREIIGNKFEHSNLLEEK